MFDNYVFTEGSCRNVEKEGKIAGFSLQTLITYYRGIPCSMIHDVRVKVNGQDIDRKNIRFSPNGEEYFTLDELETVTTYKWEYGEQAYVFVEKDGGLLKGENEITLTTAIRVAYIPVPFEGSKTRTVVIH